MSEALVFCTKWSGSEKYEWFWHEADVLLYALGQEVAAKNMTSEQAREVYARHYDVEDTYLVKPEDIEDEKAAYWKDWQNSYGSRDEVEEDLERAFGEYGNFPLNEELDYLPNSMGFWEEAARLGLEGVGFSDDISPASGPIFEAEDDAALAALREAFQGRYRILPCGEADNYVISSYEDAIEFIERMR